MKNLILLFTLLVLISCQSQWIQEVDHKLPFDSKIVKGKLDNGLGYYILANPKPENRAYIRLIINAGSMNEDDDQRGVAHIVEHMAFNGSKRFPENQIIQALEQLGMKFARDINAFTDFEHTVYTLNLANNDQKTLDLAFDVLDEWVNHLTILQKDLDNERGIVLEEWRSRLSPMLRLGDKKSKIEMANSRYVLRDPIGEVEVINNVSRERVNDFYRKWYRPDNITLVVVGDIQTQQIVNLIKRKFNYLTRPQLDLPTIDYKIPLSPSWRLANVAEQGITTPAIEFSFMEDFYEQNTIASYKQDFIRQTLIKLLNSRLQQWEKSQANIESANFYSSTIGKETLQHIYSLQLKEENYTQQIENLFKFIAQIKQYGFTQQELNDELAYFYRLNERTLDIQEGSLKLADDLMLLAANDQVALSKKTKYQLNKQIIETIRLEDIQAEFERIINLSAKLMLITQTYPEKKLNFNKTELEKLWQQTFIQPQQLWQVKNAYQAIPQFSLEPSTAILQRYWENKGNIKEFRLGNDSKLVYYYSDKSPDRIYFKAVTAGGLRSIEPNKYHLLRAASNLVDETGIGILPKESIEHLFQSNSLMLSTMIDDYYQGFIGVSRSNDLETILKLFRLKLQTVSISEQAFEKYQQDNLHHIENLDVEDKFIRSVFKLRYPNIMTPYTLTLADINKLDRTKLIDLYQQYILEKTDFTYFIVGDISEKQAVDLAKQYLANIEVKKQDRNYYLVKSTPLKKELKVKNNTEPRAEVEIYFNLKNQWQPEQEFILDILAEAIQEKLRLELRENQSGIYASSVWIGQDEKSPQIEARIQFSADPMRIDELVKNTDDILADYQINGIEPQLLQKKIAEKKQQIKQQFDSLLYILGLIEFSYRNTDSPELIYLYQQLEQIVTKQQVDDIARKLFIPSNSFKAILTN